VTGNVSYDPVNHEVMTRLRHERIEVIGEDLPEATVDDPSNDSSVLVVGWGSTRGPIATGVARLRARGLKVAHLQLRWVRPLPRNLGEILSRYQAVVVAENNMGQLQWILRAKYLVDARLVSKVQGVPFFARDVEQGVLSVLDELGIEGGLGASDGADPNRGFEGG
jgi:2-oxoglutarate ferredoxin oxidoreductase subunit alpha